MARLTPAVYEALLDVVLEADAVEEPRPFPDQVLEAMRRAVPCDSICYREWNAEGEIYDQSIAADGIEERYAVWTRYPDFRRDDPIPGAPARDGDLDPLPEQRWIGRPLVLSDFVGDLQFRRRGLYREILRPLGVRAVMKIFLPTDGSCGRSFVFDTSHSDFTDGDRLTVKRLLPHLVQLRRNATAREGYAAVREAPAATRSELLGRLTPREWVVLERVASGQTNAEIAVGLFIGPPTVRKHLEHIFEKLEVRNRTAAAAVYLGRP